MRSYNFVKQYCKSDSPRIVLSASFLYILAGAILLVPIYWVAAWLLALAIHEFCHYVALKLCGASVSCICLGGNGIVMETQQLSYGKEAICAYAGPLGALLILLFARYVPRTSICTIVLSAYNLLPIFPLDGGRGLGCALKAYLPENTALCIMRYIENAVLALITTLMCYAVWKLNLGILPALVTIILLCRSKRIKFPCKKCRLGLQ